MRHVMRAATMGIAVLLLAAASGAAADGKIPSLVVKGPLDAMVGHVQGACASEDAIYLSHIAGIFKLDWNGNVIKHVQAERHTGDLCYHDGKVYSVLGKWGSGGKTKVCRLQVRDADLNFVDEKPLPELKGLDGVTVLDGILYQNLTTDGKLIYMTFGIRHAYATSRLLLPFGVFANALLVGVSERRTCVAAPCAVQKPFELPLRMV